MALIRGARIDPVVIPDGRKVSDCAPTPGAPFRQRGYIRRYVVGVAVRCVDVLRGGVQCIRIWRAVWQIVNGEGSSCCSCRTLIHGPHLAGRYGWPKVEKSVLLRPCAVWDARICRGRIAARNRRLQPRIHITHVRHTKTRRYTRRYLRLDEPLNDVRVLFFQVGI